MDDLPGTTVRKGPPRVMRSALTDSWYLVSPPYRDLGGGRIVAGRKRDVHPEDQDTLDTIYQAWEVSQHSILLDPSELAAHIGHNIEITAEYAPEGDIARESEIIGIVLACDCDEVLGRADTDG